MRIGVDIGGTFTDVVAIDESGSIVTVKTPSTPEDPSRGVLDGLILLSERLSTTLSGLLARTALLIHGTTVATNCLAERKGALTGMITTAGFRDVLELREGTKARRYDLHLPFPQPLIERPARLEVAERMRWDGAVAVELDEAEARRALSELRASGVQAVVVGFLHAHANPQHELRLRALIEQMDWQPYVVLSHEILCSEGEYDRFSTASVNAYVGPRLSHYLERLAHRLAEAGARCPVLIMQSTGGLLPVAQASRYAVGCVTSGPAGGAQASALFARLARRDIVVAYDTGGTTTDVSLIEQGRPVERRKTEYEDLKIAIPSLDISVVALGGGSLARIDAGGILTLGPDSAGAVPGPACYGRGGERPTLTDANLVLGYLSADTFLDGRMKLHPQRARDAIARHVADPLGLSIESASLAIHALASNRIAEGVRGAALRRGLDPRDLTLLSFGGAGGAHVSAVRRELSIGVAMVPREASVFSALGFLSADVRLDAQQPFGRPLGECLPSEIAALFARLRAQMHERLEACGFPPARRRMSYFVDCRYHRQTSTIEIALTEESLEATDFEWLRECFETAYRRYYGHVHAGELPVIESCRVCGYGQVGQADAPRCSTQGARGTRPPPGFRASRRVFRGEWAELPVHWFDRLLPDEAVSGPALIESPTTAIVLDSDDVGRVDELGSLWITRQASQES